MSCDVAGGGGGGDDDDVLYKRIPPPSEPQDDGPTSPSSPSYECYPEYCTMPPTNNYPGRRLDDDDYHDWSARIPNNLSTCNLGDDFSALYSDDDDDCGLSPADLERQTNEYITGALHHYNSQDHNQVKYELVRAIYISTGIIDERGFYGHVNFIAKCSLENSKEELLFAEVYYQRGSDTCIPTCIVSLQGKKGIGGVKGKDICGPYRGGMGIRVDTQHCYACLEALKHPEDGTLYETGHHVDDYYGYLL
ncbi:hypothetical protein ZWY2020_057183 [Hordeum vulgare]|nr:hypothetical protein ZWY2020_057183 [Hordeum vulgare]